MWIDGPLAELRASRHLPADITTALSDYGARCSLEILDPVYRITVPSSPQTPNRKPLGFVVGKTWLVTVTEPRPGFMDRFVDADKGETLNGRMTPSALAVALLTELLDGYRSELSHIDNQVDKLDEAILASRERRKPLVTLAVLRRQVSTLRSVLDETGITLHAMVRPDFLAHIAPADHGYFEGLVRAHERVEDMVARARETIVGKFRPLYHPRRAGNEPVGEGS
ncbi:MAG: CorA family divalent cation transporter [Asticcacaulis sp.]